MYISYIWFPNIHFQYQIFKCILLISDFQIYISDSTSGISSSTLLSLSKEALGGPNLFGHIIIFIIIIFTNINNNDNNNIPSGSKGGDSSCAPISKAVEDWDVVPLKELHHGLDQCHLWDEGGGSPIQVSMMIVKMRSWYDDDDHHHHCRHPYNHHGDDQPCAECRGKPACRVRRAGGRGQA